jgi:hypothetical protein
MPLITYYHIQMIPSEPEPPTTPPPEIEALLHKFQHLFTIPTSLPPNRPTDHRISLTKEANPVNVRPYRYP